MKKMPKRLNFFKVFYSAIVIIGSIYFIYYLVMILSAIFPNNQADIVAFVLSIISAFVIVEFTFLRNVLLVYNRNLDDLIEEISYIRDRADSQYFFSCLWICEDLLLHSNSQNNTWLRKSTSYGLSYGLYQKPSDEISHGIPGYILQFFPSKAYYKFMERGLYEEIRESKGWINKRDLSEGRLSALMHIYDYTIEFSQKSQQVEHMAHKLKKDENYEMNLNLLYSAIASYYNEFKPNFDEHISKFDPENLKGLKLTFMDLLSDYLFRFVDKHLY